jgi:transcriptional regulator with XRE-family HTH domain
MMAETSFEETFLKHLGRNVRRLREARGWTQEKLAEHTGLQRSYISQIETGNRNFSAVVLARLLLAFDSAPEELLGDAVRAGA